MNYRAVIFALVSAALFGVSTPAAKVPLGTVDPAILAGLLYCGAGVGVAMLRRILKVMDCTTWNLRSRPEPRRDALAW